MMYALLVLEELDAIALKGTRSQLFSFERNRANIEENERESVCVRERLREERERKR